MHDEDKCTMIKMPIHECSMNAHNHTVRGKTANSKNLTGSNSTDNVTKCNCCWLARSLLLEPLCTYAKDLQYEAVYEHTSSVVSINAQHHMK
jgi:hypothetical protein